jgi:membrane-associated phospholipid phosphatase
METRLLLWIHGLSRPALDDLFVFSHVLGTLPFCVALVAGAALWHRVRGERREAALWIVLGLTTYLVQAGLKAALARPRPALWIPLVTETNFAFPSGHALAAATFYPLLAYLATRGAPRAAKAVGYLLAAAVALYIGVGRLYLGVHWPSDVLAGWILGILQTAAGVLWLERRGRGDRMLRGS